MSGRVCACGAGLCSIVFLTLTITFGVFWKNSEFFTVNGTLDRVDECKTNCFAGVGPNGCLYHAAVTLSWTYQNVSFSTSNFSTSACRQCCYDSVNKSVLVEIDPATPSVARHFWFSDVEPQNESYIALASVCGTLFICCLIVACAIIRNSSYERLK